MDTMQKNTMRGNEVLGIIYSNSYDSALPELTTLRTMGSVPFAGRYRLIDFPLSSMVNAGISHVGVITKSNYRSLMDHLGTGKPWDLSRKREGMFLLPPFSSSNSTGVYEGRVDALHSIASFIRGADKEYVLLCDSNIVCNFDVEGLLQQHAQTGADITVACRHGKAPNLEGTLCYERNEAGRIVAGGFSTQSQQEALYGVNYILLKKALLERLILEAFSLRKMDFENDILLANIGTLQIYGYEIPGFARVIDSLQSYYDISLSLLLSENRRDLFHRERPVYTKVRDEMPAIYGLDSAVQNSLVADGCKIDGFVENSILFRGAQVARGVIIKNSVILQDSFIGDGAQLENVILDKQAVVRPQKVLIGAGNYPVYVGKGIVI